MILDSYLAYQLSFKATIEAILLNGELSKREHLVKWMGLWFI